MNILKCDKTTQTEETSEEGKPLQNILLLQVGEDDTTKKTRKRILKSAAPGVETAGIEKNQDHHLIKRRRGRQNEPTNKFAKQYDAEELSYYKALETNHKLTVIDVEQRMYEMNNAMIPLRFKILLSDMDEKIKSIAIKKLGYLSNLDESSSEYYKNLHWIHSVCDLPINKYKNLPVSFESPPNHIRDFIINIRQHLNSIVYGHEEAKEQIVRLLAQWISNPDAKGMVIGIQGPAGCGKCHAKDTPILLCDGSLKMVQDIEIGDTLMGDDSTPRRVLALGRGQDDMFRVSEINSDYSYAVNSEHILCLKQLQAKHHIVKKQCGNQTGYAAQLFNNQKKCFEEVTFRYHRDAIQAIHGHVVEIPVRDYVALSNDERKAWLKGYRAAIEFSYVDVPEDPYDVGYSFNLQNKALPKPYMINDWSVRMSFLAGFLDAHGKKYKSGSHKLLIRQEQLAREVVFLSRSLGYRADIKQLSPDAEWCIRIFASPVNKQLLLSTVRSIPEFDEILCYDLKIDHIGKGDYFGFTLDENQRYLIGDLTVTHNTTLIKDGICQVLGLPFQMIALGGASDGSFLDGHSYTYEGATWGKIVDTLMKTKCMNPVFFFDELDKISNTYKGDEIVNILIHLTDSSQNDMFHDKYFTDFDFDLSKCLMIFSYNNESAINPILKDRLMRIHTNGYDTKAKIAIARDYMFPMILKEYSFGPKDIILTDDVIRSIIEMIEEEKGVRNLKRAIQNIVSHINLSRILECDSLDLPYTITDEDTREYINNKKQFSTLPFMYI
jgi:hypothetical protein